jgi:hypothetical protein
MTRDPQQSEIPQLKSCPKCRRDRSIIVHDDFFPESGYRVLCPMPCVTYGPERPTAMEAIAAWNTRYESEIPKGG